MYIKNKAIFVLYIIALIIINLYISIPVFALDPHNGIHHYIHKSWQLQDGLPQSSIQAITQTKDGYIWLGTEEGLVRFDGIQFKIFDKKNTASFTNNNIKAIYEDESGILWIGTYDGGLLQYKDHLFKIVIKASDMPDKRISAITGDNDGNLWISTKSGGLIKYKNGLHKTFTIKNGLSSNNINSIYRDSKGNLWIGTFDAGLALYKNNTFKTFDKKDGLSGNNISAIYEDKDGVLWIGTSDKNLNFYKNGHFHIFNPDELIFKSQIQSIYQDKDKNLWIGTFGSGLIRYSNNKLLSFTSEDGLTNDMISAIYEDREGNIWIGTYGGLNVLKESRVKVYTQKDGLSHDDITTIFEDSNNDLWIGTWDKGLNRFHNNKFSSFSNFHGLSNNQIKSIYEDKKGNIWIGTFGGGITLYSNGNFSTISKNDGLSNNSVLAIYGDNNGYLWIGTYGGGLNRYKDGNIEVFTIKDGLSSNDILTIFEDSKSNIWIGTEGGGLNLYSNGIFKNFTEENGFYNKMVFAFYEDSSSNLWIGTRDGLYLYKNNKFVVYTTKEGLFDDTVLAILEDNNNNLWMSCNKGIFSVNKNELLNIAKGKSEKIKSVSYGIEDGMKSQECNGGFQSAGFKTKNGNLYFPTTKGLIEIDPDNLPSNKTVPNVIIERVITNGENRDIENQLTFDAETDKIEIHYTAPSFVSPNKVKFEYMLEGIDEDWVKANTRRAAYYTTIPPGKYKFKVKACNNDGLWNNTGATIEFEKLPHFYQTKWFYIFCVFIVVLIFYGIYDFRVRKEKTKQKRLENFNVKLKNEVNKQTLELKKRNQDLSEKKIELENVLSDLKISQQKMTQQARMASLGNLVSGVSHEIGNPLNAVITGTDVIEMTIEDAENLFVDLPVEPEHLDEIELVLDKFKNAHNLILEGNKRIKKIIGNFRSFLQSGKVSLEEYDIKDGIKSCIMLLHKRIESQNIEVITNFNDLPLIKCKAGEINQVITNLIINSLDVMPESGKIEISGRVIGKNIEISFSDTGPGIVEEIRESIFDPFFTTKDPSKGTGLGLYMSHEIISGIGGELSLLDSEVGALFSIQLPVE